MPATRRSNLHPERNTRVSSYQARIERRLVDIYHECPEWMRGREYVRGSERWTFVGAAHTHGYAQCELCGHRPIRRLFWVQNVDTGQTLMMGSECIVNYADANLVRGFVNRVTTSQNRNRRSEERQREREEREATAAQIRAANIAAWNTCPRREEILAYLSHESNLALDDGYRNMVMACRRWLQNGFLTPAQTINITTIIDRRAVVADRPVLQEVSETPAIPAPAHNAERGELPHIADGTYEVIRSTDSKKFQIHTVQNGGLAGKRIIKVLRDGVYKGFAFLTTTPGVKTWRSAQEWVSGNEKTFARAMISGCDAQTFAAWNRITHNYQDEHYIIVRSDVVLAPAATATETPLYGGYAQPRRGVTPGYLGEVAEAEPNPTPEPTPTRRRHALLMSEIPGHSAIIR